MNNFDLLDLYEVRVVESLVQYYAYNLKEATSIVLGYREVINQIGCEDNHIFWAEKLDEAMKHNITPYMWLAVL